MPILAKGKSIGIKAVDYTSICVGDQLLDPDSHLTLIVDKYGRILDNFGVEHKPKDVYYSIFCKADVAQKSPMAAKGPRPEIPPKPEPKELTDEDHVKALRDHGWTVTCTKTVTTVTDYEL